MAKISKRLLKYHNQALDILKEEKLDFYQRKYVFDNFHEGAGNMNNLIGAHFTPHSIAKSMTFNIRENNFVDLCAGIGMLSYKLLRDWEFNTADEKPFGICIENCTHYYEVGKKLLPEFHWINGDIFDEKVIKEVKDLMRGKDFSIISNSPYGKQVKSETSNILKYKGGIFEYKAIELGAVLGANDGAFLIPQQSAPFRMSGRETRGNEFGKEHKSKDYNKFVKETGLEINANIGFSTNIIDEDDKGWKDVNIITEIGILEYSELGYESIYKPKVKVIKLKPQTSQDFGEQIQLF